METLTSKEVLNLVKATCTDKQINEFGIGTDFPDSYPCGSVIVKTNSEEGDLTPDGKEGIIIGCRYVEYIPNELAKFPYKYAYLVIFIKEPYTEESLLERMIMVFLVDYKLKLVKNGF